MIIVRQKYITPNYTDFLGYSNAALNGQRDWSLTSGATGISATVGTDGAVSSGKSVAWTSNDAGNGEVYWGRPGTSLHDQTVLMAFEVTSGTFIGSTDYIGFSVLATGTTTTWSGLTAFLGTSSGAKTFIGIAERTPTYTLLASGSFTWALNTKMWMKVQVTGNTIRVRAWNDGAAEPGTWAATYTNASIVGGKSGRTGIGVGLYLGDPTASITSKHYWFAVGTGSNEPQTPPWSF